MKAVKAISDQAIAFLDTQRLAPTPQNYTLAFAHLDGAHGELTSAVNALLEGGVRLKQTEADELYEQFLGRAAFSVSPVAVADPGADSLRHQTLRLADLAASATAVTGEFSRELASQLPEWGVADAAGLERLVTATIARAQRSERELAATTAQVEQLRQQLETVQGDAERDALTGLPNRRGIDAYLADAIGTTPAVLAICDIDRFKSYNDRYGHAVGDRVLKTVAQTLRESLDGHFVGRWGGEEFIVVANSDLGDGIALLNRAKATLGARHFKLRETDEPMGKISFSAGVVALPSDADALGGAIEAADALLYKAKEGGRDLVLGA